MWSKVRALILSRVNGPPSTGSRNALKNIKANEIPDDDFPDKVIADARHINIPIFIQVAHIKGYDNIHIAYFLRSITSYAFLLKVLKIGDGHNGMPLNEEALQGILELFTLRNIGIEEGCRDNFQFLINHLSPDGELLKDQILEMTYKHLEDPNNVLPDWNLSLICYVKHHFQMGREDFDKEIYGENLMKRIDAIARQCAVDLREMWNRGIFADN